MTRIFCLWAVMLSVVGALPCRAVTVAPGASVIADYVFSAPLGEVLASRSTTYTQMFDGRVAVTTTLTSEVIQTTSSTLAFRYTLAPSIPYTFIGAPHQITVSDFTGASTDVSFIFPFESGSSPALASRSLAGDALTLVNFNHGGAEEVINGFDILVQTDARAYQFVPSRMDIVYHPTFNTTSTTSVEVFAPLAAETGVPEPTSIALLSLASAALLFRLRRPLVT